MVGSLELDLAWSAFEASVPEEGDSTTHVMTSVPEEEDSSTHMMTSVSEEEDSTTHMMTSVSEEEDNTTHVMMSESSIIPIAAQGVTHRFFVSRYFYPDLKKNWTFGSRIRCRIWRFFEKY